MLYTDVASLPAVSASQSRFVIIGSGAVGLYAASLLAGRGCQVVLIEAGERHLGTFAADSYASVGRPHSGIALARSRSLGGTTNLWGGQLVEFQPIDFNGRAWLEGSRWPVTYNEIAPYYPPTYTHLGIPPQMQGDEDVWQGISARRPELGRDLEVFLTRWMKVPNVAVLFAKQISSDEKLAVLTGCTATEFRGAAGKIQAVQVIDKSGAAHWIQGDAFVLAAGTIENARLLLHSAQSRNWECPWRDNQHVGGYFQDHLVSRVGDVTPTDKRAFFEMFCTIVLGGQKFQPKVRLRNEVLEKQPLLNVQGTFLFEGKASEHLIYLKQFLRAAVFSRKLSGIGDVFRHGVGAVKFLVPLMWTYLKDHRVFVPGTARITLGVQAEQSSLAQSRITIDNNARDAHGLPRVVLDWRVGEHELRSTREFGARLGDAMQRAGIGRLDMDDDLLHERPVYLDKMHDNYHQAGGAVMGFSERDGVVDKDCRVFGTSNLYVGGASVFRTSSNANPTFTAIAFATRLADHLSGFKSIV